MLDYCQTLVKHDFKFVMNKFSYDFDKLKSSVKAFLLSQTIDCSKSIASENEERKIEEETSNINYNDKENQEDPIRVFQQGGHLLPLTERHEMIVEFPIASIEPMASSEAGSFVSRNREPSEVTPSARSGSQTGSVSRTETESSILSVTTVSISSSGYSDDESGSSENNTDRGGSQDTEETDSDGDDGGDGAPEKNEYENGGIVQNENDEKDASSGSEVQKVAYCNGQKLNAEKWMVKLWNKKVKYLSKKVQILEQALDTLIPHDHPYINKAILFESLQFLGIDPLASMLPETGLSRDQFEIYYTLMNNGTVYNNNNGYTTDEENAINTINAINLVNSRNTEKENYSSPVSDVSPLSYVDNHDCKNGEVSTIDPNYNAIGVFDDFKVENNENYRDETIFESIHCKLMDPRKYDPSYIPDEFRSLMKSQKSAITDILLAPKNRYLICVTKYKEYLKNELSRKNILNYRGLSRYANIGVDEQPHSLSNIWKLGAIIQLSVDSMMACKPLTIENLEIQQKNETIKALEMRLDQMIDEMRELKRELVTQPHPTNDGHPWNDNQR